MLDEERLKEHYAQLVDKPFFPSIAEFMMSGSAVIGIMSGPGVIKSWRDMMGATNPGAVSYTHLDVYKRQKLALLVQPVVKVRSSNVRQNVIVSSTVVIAILTVNVRPVSYTHLWKFLILQVFCGLSLKMNWLD